MKLLLERPNRCFERWFAPQNVARQGSRTSWVVPVLVHPFVPGNVPLLACKVLVLGII